MKWFVQSTSSPPISVLKAEKKHSRHNQTRIKGKTAVEKKNVAELPKH